MDSSQTLDLGQRQVGERPSSVRRQWRVERGLRRAHRGLGQQVLAVISTKAERPRGAEDVGDRGDPGDQAGQVGGNPDGLQRLAGQGERASTQHPGRGGLLLTLEDPSLRQHSALGRDIEHSGEDVASGDSVDRGVMDLGVDGGPPALEPGDEVDLPQWAAAVQRPRMQAGHLLGQLPVVAGGRHGRLPDVKLDVEVRVLDPVRMVEPEGNRDQPAPKERDQRKSRLDDLGEALKGQP